MARDSSVGTIMDIATAFCGFGRVVTNAVNACAINVRAFSGSSVSVLVTNVTSRGIKCRAMLWSAAVLGD